MQVQRHKISKRPTIPQKDMRHIKHCIETARVKTTAAAAKAQAKLSQVRMIFD